MCVCVCVCVCAVEVGAGFAISWYIVREYCCDENIYIWRRGLAAPPLEARTPVIQNPCTSKDS